MPPPPRPPLDWIGLLSDLYSPTSIDGSVTGRAHGHAPAVEGQDDAVAVGAGAAGQVQDGAAHLLGAAEALRRDEEGGGRTTRPRGCDWRSGRRPALRGTLDGWQHIRRAHSLVSAADLCLVGE